MTSVAALTLALTASAVAASPETPPGNSSAETGSPHARVSLIAEESSWAPGSTGHLGLHFKLDPHWHTYWLGAPAESSQLAIDLSLPAGLTAGPILWPAPKRLISEGDLLDYVFEDEVTLIIPVRIAESVAAGDAKISARVNYMICHTTCVFEDAAVAISQPIAAAGVRPTPSPAAAKFVQSRARLPKPLPKSGEAAPRLTRAGSTVDIDVPDAKGVSFFPAADCVLIEDPIRTAHAEKPRLRLALEAGADDAAPFRGVLEVRYADGRGTIWYAVEPKDLTVKSK